MEGYVTPASFQDGATDHTRPHNTEATFNINNQMTLCRFDAGQMRWHPKTSVASAIPQIVFQASSPLMPYSLPPTPWPLNAVGTGLHPATVAQPEQPTTQFDPLLRSAPVAVFSARMLLEADVPTVSFLKFGQSSISSTTNQLYATISQLTEWRLPEGLSGYYDLPADLRYSSIDANPAIQVIGEQDAVWAARSYIVTPVELVLCQNSPYTIRCTAEDSHTRKVPTGISENDTVSHISRVDLSWSVKVLENWYRFAVLEFKRPGAINGADWSPAIQNHSVVGSAKRICQQLCKYAYTFSSPFVAVCDLHTLLLLRLGGEAQQWRSDLPNRAFISAHFRWVDVQNEMKRNLYVFLAEALQDCFRRMGFM